MTVLKHTPASIRKVRGPQPRIGDVFLCDRESNLKVNRPNYPHAQPFVELEKARATKKSELPEPPIYIQIAIGALMASALILACFL